MQTGTPTNVIEMSRPCGSGSHLDRRNAARLRLTYTVSLSRPGESSGIVTKTENVSCKGFFCYSDRVFSPYEMLDCEMAIPGSWGSFPTNDLVMSALVEVVRVTPLRAGRGFGVACRIESYMIHPRNYSHSEE